MDRRTTGTTGDVSRGPLAPGIPLAPQQRVLWGAFDPAHMPATQCLLRAPRACTASDLRARLQWVASLHDALRFTVGSDDGAPALQAGDGVDVLVREYEAAPSELDRIACEQREGGFDVRSRPQLRAALIRDGQASWLLVTVCAFFMDAYSTDHLARQIVVPARESDEEESGEAAPAQSYLNYCLWQQEVVKGDPDDADVPFWALTDWAAIEPVPLPYARESAIADSGHWIRRTSLSREDLDRICHEESVDAESVLFAAFQGFVCKLARTRELRMGYVANGRTLEELQSCLGLLAKTLPVHVRLRDAGTLAEQARQARQQIDAAVDWQDTFDPTDHARQSHEDVGHRVTFEYLPNEERPSLGAVSGERCIGVSDASDLKLVAQVEADRIALTIVCRRASFDERSSVWLADLFAQWTSRLLAPGSGPVLRHGLLGEDDGRAVIASLNPQAGSSTATAAVPMHELFEQCARESPDATAVVERSGSTTYASLATRSDRLAARLRALGLQPWDVIGIHLPRSADLLIAILGIHKLGACHVLLDIQQPMGRNAAILRDAGAKAVVSRGDLDPDVAAFGLATVRIDELPEDDGVRDVRTHDVPLESPAYILYTSGSTGYPKGVTVSHRSLTNYLQWAQRYYAPDGPCRALAHTSPAVDLSVTALLVPLISGGWVDVVADEEGIDGLFRVLHESDHVGLLKMTPTHAALLVGHLPPGDYAPAKFEALVLGGENLNYEQLTPWLVPAGSPRVVNEYGPTEATVACCAFDVRPGEARGRVPIGGPIAGARVYVVDAAMQPVPEGVPGELLIAGDVLSDGYRNRPALTAAAFVPDPFAVTPGARAYHSGDLVASRGPLGLEYRGRLDRQVKIRGYRVELDEIEAVLQRHPDVSRAAVDLQFIRGDASIVAYVAVNEGAELSARALRDFCKEELAAHMIPNDVVMLGSLPLTRSGKVDLRALAREAPAARSETEYLGARDGIEAELVAIWEDHVGKERVGVRDNFFDLGGHSMMGIRILFDIRRRMRAEVDLGDIFDRPTIEALAARIRQRGSPDVPAVETWFQDPIAPDPASRHEPFTLTDVQQAYWVGQTDAYALGNVGAHVYQETEFEGLDLERLQAAFRTLISRHDMMRVIILPDGRQQVLEHVPDYEIETFDLRGQSPDRQQASVRDVRDRMSHQVFDLATWPLFAVCASLIDDRHVRLHLSFDALMADAWSFEILLRDFSRLYMQPEVPLPPLQLRFRDYVQATAGSPDSPLFLRAQSYWKDRIAALPPAPQLPMVKQLREIVAPRFERRRHIVGEARWSQIKKRAATAKVTPSALMLAAFAEVLSRWSKSQSFSLVITVFNRPPLHPEIDEIVGDFTSLVLIEFHASAARFEQRVQDVHKQLMERLEHRYFSGVRVMRELARQQADKATPLMPVVFTSTLTHRRTEEAAFLKEQQVEAMGINQTPQIYLDHQLVEQNGELQFNWDSVDELFPPGMLDVMFEQYCAFVESLTEEPAWQRSPDLLPPSVMQAYATLNDTAAPALSRLAIQPMLEAAARRPESPAIISDQRQVSYAELVGTSWRIARALRARGVTPGAIVGILLEKGWEQVASVLGVVFAGAAYVPIDPQAPADRIDYVIRDSGLAILITHSALRRGLTPEIDYLLWDEPSWFEHEPSEPLALVQLPSDLLYLIYTSGSTGRPKGVMIEHASVANRMHDIRGRFAIGPADRALGLTALHHDLSVFDIFGVLGAGATLVLPSAPLQRDPGHWTELMAAHTVTLWNSVPAFMAMLVEFHAGRGGHALADTAGLRVLLSGDKIPLALVERMRQLLPDASLYSLGGPTETTVWDICHPIGPLDVYSQRLPYGRPLSNARYYVLDGADRLCPVNVPGELCIAGQGLARGYWRDEEKTAAKFVWHEPTAERLYRSGDLGCLRPDGELDILGRLDLQVKIHGQRIELEEIELTLQQHPAVRAAAVAVRMDPVQGPSLAAYLEVASAGDDYVEPPAGSTDAHGTLLNSIERIQFKMEQRGIRHDIPAEAPSVDLVRPDLTDDYLKAIMRRRTQRHFAAVAIGTEQASGFLGLLMQVMPTGFAMPKYQYPSAGNAYPLQFYLLVRDGRIAGVPEGAYYYHPRAHRLVMLSPEGDWDDRLHAVNNAPVSQQAAFSLFVVCEMEAMVPLYGDKAIEFGLLEAGYVSQLLMSRAPDFNLGLCPIGTMDFDPLRARLALGASQRLFHAFVGGAVAEEEFSDPKLYLTDTSKKWSQPVASDTIADVTAFLHARLPRHMIPDQFAIVQRLPYTSNGKIDRAALDVIELRGAARHGFVEPQTDLQQALAGLWASVLGIEKVGLHDDFFQLGGDSILAVQLMNRLKASFSTEIPLRDVLAATTVERLAAFIEQKLAAELDAAS
jgi:amino acid adenylation domain-containing protein